MPDSPKTTHEIVLSFNDDGSGHFDDIAIVDRTGLSPTTLAAFLRFLAGEMIDGSVETGGDS